VTGIPTGRGIMAPLIDEWQALRQELRAMEVAEHPDITDALGRVWKWKDGDLYTHDSIASPKAFVTRPKMSLPTQAALENPNYQWCEICKTPAVMTVSTILDAPAEVTR
jgi:hypothetical protein